MLSQPWNALRAPRGGALALLALLALLGLVPRAAAGDPPVVQYRIEARVDGEEKLLHGKESLVWRNATSQPTEELWFHLYWNAFSNNQSTHLWESGGSLRGGAIRSGWGWQRPTAIRVDGEDRLVHLQWRSPDDGRPEDKTVFVVPLARPVGPGESVEVAIEWEAAIPRVRRRTGYKEDFLFIAQWFPKIGVLEEGRGWNCHQFHASTEFYADYGTYDVTIDLPLEYADKVGASGVQVGPPELDRAAGRVRTRFLAPSREDRARVDATGKQPLVHDFAWTADPDYIVHQATFYYGDWARQYAEEVARTADALGRDPLEIHSRDVRVTVLIQPERESQWQRHFDATCTALFFYGLWFGEYPYEHVTAVDPAWGAGAAGGMEYPTLFTCGSELFNAPSMHSPEGVAVHECGHQFWYGLVGNNEFEAAWMDEGFNSYTDSEALVRRYGEQRATTRYADWIKWGVRPTSLPGGGEIGEALSLRRLTLPTGGLLGGGDLELAPLPASAFLEWWRDQPYLTFVEQYSDPRWSDRRRYLDGPRSDPVRKNAWEYATRGAYGLNSYQRPAIVLRSLPAVVGHKAFLRGMRHYSEAWRYAHPYPDDFVRSFSEGAEQDLSWYFDDLLGSTKTIDWRVDVSQSEVPALAGFVLADEDGFRAVEKQASEEGEKEPAREAGAGAKSWRYDVLLQSRGELCLPVDVRATFDDGTSRDFSWTREAQQQSHWWRLPLEPGQAKLRSVVIDPERLWWIDEDMSDNQWYATEEGQSLAPLRWTERVLTQYSHLLHFFSMTGG